MLKPGIKNGTEVTLNLPSNVVGDYNDETNFPRKQSNTVVENKIYNSTAKVSMDLVLISLSLTLITYFPTRKGTVLNTQEYLRSYQTYIRSSRCYVKKLFLRISQNSQESIRARVSFLIKLRS